MVADEAVVRVVDRVLVGDFLNQLPVNIVLISRSATQCTNLGNPPTKFVVHKVGHTPQCIDGSPTS